MNVLGFEIRHISNPVEKNNIIFKILIILKFSNKNNKINPERKIKTPNKV